MSLNTKINLKILTLPSGVSVYLFGSGLYSDIQNDIDLLIIYDKSKVDVNEAIGLRKKVRAHFEQITDVPVEIVLLNEEENEETGFIKNTRTLLLKR